MKICFGFDGIIHSFISPWQGDEIIPDMPTSGCKEALRHLKELGIFIYIHSARCRCQAGRKAIKTYMINNKLHFDQVVEHKPIADLYVDDHAVLFDDNWADIMQLIYHAIHCKLEKNREKIYEALLKSDLCVKADLNPRKLEKACLKPGDQH